MAGRLAGKVCVITGTGGSMGRATALTFAREGASVVGCDVIAEPAAATVEMVRAAGGQMVSLHPSRISDPAECASLVELVTGVSVELAAGTAITYLVELRLRADPKASAVRTRTIGTSVTVGALGIGPLIAGCLAQWVTQPLTVPYLVFVALGVVALAGLWAAPETGAAPPPEATGNQPAGSRRKVRLPVPAAAGTLAAFSANGLFAGLSGLFLATTLHHPSHALSGAALFLVFACGVASQLATATLQASLVLTLGTISMLAGLVLLVVSVRLSTPSLALFLIAGR